MPSEPVEGEGEGQHHRFHPETHDHFPDTSETDPPQGPSVPWEDGLLEILDHDQSYDGLEETEIVEDRAAAAARAQAAAAVERQQWIDSQAPESVMPDIDHVLGPPDFIPSGFPEPEHESAPASSWAFPFGWSVIAAAAFILAVAVGGFLLFGGGPDAGEVAVDTPSQAVEAADGPAADAPAADVPAADAGSSLESSSSGSSDGPAVPAATPTDSQPDACEVAAGQVSTLSFKSPDVGPAISRLFWFVSAYDLGFPTPAFEWEGVPEATTLLLITVQEINDAEAVGIADGTFDLVADGWPTAAVRWKATIPSNLTALDRTWFTGDGEPDDTKVASHGDAASQFEDAARELPAGVVEWFHGSVIVQVGGEFVANKFSGPDGPGDVFLFTIFALCDPPEVVFDADNPDARAYRPDWARPYAIDQAWFLASS